MDFLFDGHKNECYKSIPCERHSLALDSYHVCIYSKSYVVLHQYSSQPSSPLTKGPHCHRHHHQTPFISLTTYHLTNLPCPHRHVRAPHHCLNLLLRYRDGVSRTW